MFLKLKLLFLSLTLLVARIPGTDDADRSVAFDDLAEFASALHRSSDFHDVPASPKFFLVVETAQNTKNPSRASRPLTRSHMADRRCWSN